MTYAKHDLVNAYLEASRQDHWHEDFRQDAKDFLAALENAFDLSISMDGVEDKKLKVVFMLFRSTANTLMSLGNTRQGFMDDSLLNLRIQELGSVGKNLNDLETAANQAIDQGKDACRALLNALFDVLWPLTKAPVSSKDLLAHGFDDSKRPKVQDYWDEL